MMWFHETGGRGAVVAVYRLRNTYVPTRPKPERHRLS